MWQSKQWNGQDAAFRMFTVVGIVLLLVAQPESDVGGARRQPEAAATRTIAHASISGSSPFFG